MSRTAPELAPTAPNNRTTPAGDRLTSYVRFNVQHAQYTTDLQCIRVSNLEPSDSAADTRYNDRINHETFHLMKAKFPGEHRKLPLTQQYCGITDRQHGSEKPRLDNPERIRCSSLLPGYAKRAYSWYSNIMYPLQV
ncbi:hypothetical protein AVEN_224115-1 [Araneus ventricosus]|uniref:Uncharacterized protein n=1 Tax=Araneus ventricosus TaxID=182803 RepID=A0A4Y2DXS2_ARAVE|nr:hypothetical protein AVEN_224115-1 [Araneus ventricosus]